MSNGTTYIFKTTDEIHAKKLLNANSYHIAIWHLEFNLHRNILNRIELLNITDDTLERITQIVAEEINNITEGIEIIED